MNHFLLMVCALGCALGQEDGMRVLNLAKNVLLTFPIMTEMMNIITLHPKDKAADNARKYYTFFTNADGKEV